MQTFVKPRISPNAKMVVEIKACTYSLNIGIANPSKNKHMLAISTGPDHPASYDGILADAITNFFSKTDWKEKSFFDFHQHLQVKCT